MSDDDSTDPRELDPATWEQLNMNDLLLDTIDNRLISIQDALSKPVLKQRDAIIKKIPNFWALVLEGAPPEIEQYIQPTDSLVFASCLKDIRVERFEVPSTLPKDPYTAVDLSQNPAKTWGEPRSIKITFEFGDNEWFEDRVIEKKFWFRRAKDGWNGLVSDPIALRWKPGKDLTDGFGADAVKLRAAVQKAKASAGGGPFKRSEIPESRALKKKLENTVGNISFFTFFAYRGRDISAEESAEATKEKFAQAAKVMRGEKVHDDDDDDESEVDDEEMEEIMEELDTEVFQDGEDLAISLAEDLWPGATRYFESSDLTLRLAQEDEDDLSDADFEDMDDDEDEDEDEEMADGSDDDDDEEPEDVPNIRNLVKASQQKKKISKRSRK